jgi:DNA-binding GntR family transcriptional regulator
VKPKSPTLVDKVYDKIKQEIIANRLHPGEPLLEEKLAESIRASRTPIREALRRLNHEGLVRIVPNKGAFVRVVTPRDIREIYEVREALEGFAAGQAATRLSRPEVQSLLAVAKRLRSRRSQLGYKDLRDAWESLRKMVLAAMNNDRVKSILTTMNGQIEIARHYASAPPGRIEELLSDFLAVVQALHDRDGSQASRLYRRHLDKSKKVLLKVFAYTEESEENPTERAFSASG